MATSPPVAFSARSRRTQDSPITTLMAAVAADPGIISFAAGLVDGRTLPVEECQELAAVVLGDGVTGRQALQYDTTIGLAPLRQALLEHLAALEGRPTADLGFTAADLLVTTGSQQMLYLVSEVLLDEGDIVICADPTYFVYAGVLQSLGVRVLTVPLDRDGMDVGAVDDLLARLTERGEIERVKLIYCCSYFDNPTGQTLSLPRRRALVETARRHSRRHRILVLEDAAYRELAYDEAAGLPSIKSFDRANEYVILTQTFSKPFAPGLKLGYTVLPPEVHRAVLNLKGAHDFGSANLCQHLAWAALRTGAYHRHGAHVRAEYRRKRDLLLAALEAHMPPPVRWTRPGGGLYVWLTVPPEVDTSPAAGEAGLFQQCVRRGVLYVPGIYCFQGGQPPRHHLRLSFGQVGTEQIEPGIARLAEALRSVCGLGGLGRETEMAGRQEALAGGQGRSPVA